MADNPDLALGVEFFVKAVEIPRETKKQGRPVFEDREYVRIRFPADNKRELVAPAHEMHYVSHARQQMTYAQRFAASYDAFKRDVADLTVGTPLTELPVLTEARRAELAAQGVKTVEQLAGLPDPSMRKLGIGARDLVVAAQAYLEKAQDNAEVTALKREIEALKARLGGQDAPDEYAGYSDEDLRNAISDATGEAPDGRLGRKKLIERLREIAAKKEAA